MILLNIILFNLFLNTDTTKVSKCCKIKITPQLCVGMVPSDTTKVTTKVKVKKTCCKTKPTK